MSDESLRWIKLALSHYYRVLHEMDSSLPDDCSFFSSPQYRLLDAVEELSNKMGLKLSDLIDW